MDELLESCDGPEDVLGKDGLIRQLTGRLVERVLDAELTDHLGYDKHSPAGNGSGNSRNGYRNKTLRDDTGRMEIEAPRDRAGTFEPQLVPKHTSRMPSFDEKVLSLYARGMATREIQGRLEELYGTEGSPALISKDSDRSGAERGRGSGRCDRLAEPSSARGVPDRVSGCPGRQGS